MTVIPYRLTRQGVLMRPQPGDPLEIEGVLNPGAARGPDSRWYLLPRLVGAGNYSRVGRARVRWQDGIPAGVDRLGVVLEPERPWEAAATHGGIEDPRVSWIAALGYYVMAYVAFGPHGPRPALAASSDLVRWDRLGPILFEYDDDLGIDLNMYPNKDVVLFDEPVPGPHGPSIALLHRPVWDLSFVGGTAAPPAGLVDERPSIWISYVPLAAARANRSALARPAGHRLVAAPAHDWEAVKIGAGPVPLRVPEGWLLIHHGVSGRIVGNPFDLQQHVRYSAGAMLLDAADPGRVLARSPEPLLEPQTDDETTGSVANVVFPTAVLHDGDDRFVCYGMADARIGVARLERLG